MKSLYESILDMDDEKLDASSQNLKDSELKALWDKYKLEVVKGPKGLTINKPVFLYMNSHGEPTLFHEAIHAILEPRDDAPSIAKMFPDGVVLKSVISPLSTVKYRYYGKISDLPSNVVIEELEADTQSTLESIDRKIHTVIYHLEQNAKSGTSKEMRMDWTKYVDTLVVTNKVNKDLCISFYELTDMKNCPIKNVVLLSGGSMFGLPTADKATAKIGDFKPDMDVFYQKEAYNTFTRNVKKWLKNNPNSNLFMNWHIQKHILTDDWPKQVIEQVSLDGGDLVFNTLTMSQKKKL